MPKRFSKPFSELHQEEHFARVVAERVAKHRASILSDIGEHLPEETLDNGVIQTMWSDTQPQLDENATKSRATNSKAEGESAAIPWDKPWHSYGFLHNTPSSPSCHWSMNECSPENWQNGDSRHVAVEWQSSPSGVQQTAVKASKRSNRGESVTYCKWNQVRDPGSEFDLMRSKNYEGNSSQHWYAGRTPYHSISHIPDSVDSATDSHYANNLWSYRSPDTVRWQSADGRHHEILQNYTTHIPSEKQCRQFGNFPSQNDEFFSSSLRPVDYTEHQLFDNLTTLSSLTPLPPQTFKSSVTEGFDTHDVRNFQRSPLRSQHTAESMVASTDSRIQHRHLPHGRLPHSHQPRVTVAGVGSLQESERASRERVLEDASTRKNRRHPSKKRTNIDEYLLRMQNEGKENRSKFGDTSTSIYCNDISENLERMQINGDGNVYSDGHYGLQTSSQFARSDMFQQFASQDVSANNTALALHSGKPSQYAESSMAHALGSREHFSVNNASGTSPSLLLSVARRNSGINDNYITQRVEPNAGDSARRKSQRDKLLRDEAVRNVKVSESLHNDIESVNIESGEHFLVTDLELLLLKHPNIKHFRLLQCAIDPFTLMEHLLPLPQLLTIDVGEAYGAWRSFPKFTSRFAERAKCIEIANPSVLRAIRWFGSSENDHQHLQVLKHVSIHLSSVLSLSVAPAPFIFFRSVRFPALRKLILATDLCGFNENAYCGSYGPAQETVKQLSLTLRSLCPTRSALACFLQAFPQLQRLKIASVRCSIDSTVLLSLSCCANLEEFEFEDAWWSEKKHRSEKSANAVAVALLSMPACKRVMLHADLRMPDKLALATLREIVHATNPSQEVLLCILQNGEKCHLNLEWIPAYIKLNPGTTYKPQWWPL